MRYKFTANESAKIEALVECAIAAGTKSEAKKYTNQLNFIAHDICGYSLNVYSELVSAVVAASGSVRDKDRLSDIAHDLLIKFQMNCVE